VAAAAAVALEVLRDGMEAVTASSSSDCMTAGKVELRTTHAMWLQGQPLAYIAGTCRLLAHVDYMHE